MTTPDGTLDVRLPPTDVADSTAGAVTVGPAESTLLDSVAAAKRAHTLTPHDDAAIYAALAVARALDQSIRFGAQLDAVIKGTTALRHWYTALNLTPAARERDNSWRDVPTEPDTDQTDWTGEFGAATVGDPAHP